MSRSDLGVREVLALFFVVFWEENYGSSDEEAQESFKWPRVKTPLTPQ